MDSTIFSSSRAGRDPVARLLAGAALVVALLALVFAMTGMSQARDAGRVATAPASAAAAPVDAAAAATKKKAKKKPMPGPSTKPKKYGILRLNSKKRYPAAVIPKVAAARRADNLGGATRVDLSLSCPPTSVDLGSWCLDAAPYPLPNEDAGKNDYLYASKACVDAGGYLPTAAQLLGAVDRVKLASTIDDNQTTASVDQDPSDGLKDQREMTSTLFSTAAGLSAAGSQGVTVGSRGDPRQGEPDPVPVPAVPLPATLAYVTVFDNHNHGGFAGGAAVSAPMTFRCAYSKTQGEANEE